MTALLSRAVSPRALALLIDASGGTTRQTLRERVATVIDTVDEPSSHGTGTAALLGRLEQALTPPTPEKIWLLLAVVTGSLPEQADVQRAVRASVLDGPLAALAQALPRARTDRRALRRRVRVITDEIVVDMHHTARTELATGIQRVARQTAARWARDHADERIMFVGWTPDERALCELSADQRANALHGTHPGATGSSDTVIVPWRSTYVLPELMTETPRETALLAMLRYSGSTGTMIGFDCVPITTAETVAPGMASAFARMLAAMAFGRRIAAISEAAANEYRGWRAMLAGTGLGGPDITAVPLPVEAVTPTDAAVDRAREQLVTDELPMVLCVGSHEPRKNHLAVLHAAELLWREGHEFSLVFVGGNAWGSEDFALRLDELASGGRAVQTVRGLSDELLWAAYRLARFVIFPSVNEGFGLPVAEALASGTPAITSDFGSMREIADDGGGALLVDPRNDHAIRDAMRTLLVDEDVHAELVAQALARPERTWEQYAAQTWNYLVEGRHPRADDRPGVATDTGSAER